MQSTIDAPPDQAASPSLLIDSADTLDSFFHVCPHSQTLSAHCPDLQADVVIALPCKQWSCRFCADTKIRQLAAKTREAKPNRLLTLTVDPSKWENPRAAFDGTRSKIPQLIAFLRNRFGDIAYLRVTELTKQGWPHYHLLIRSAYLPHAVVKARWKDLTGASIVDLRQVKKLFSAYTYLVKYLSKLHKIEWTERHVSYSRNFFPLDTRPPRSPMNLLEKQVVSQHPVNYLLEFEKGQTVHLLRPGLLTLQAKPKPAWN